MDLELSGKVALVAASSRGLGRAIAEALAAEGCSLMLCARGAAALEQTRDEIGGRYPVPIAAVTADLAKSADIHRLAGTAFDRFGRVDILVTNTGGPPAGPFEQHPPAAWEQAFRLMLASAVELSRAVLPGMKARRWGRILHVTSIAAKQPVDNLILSNSLRAAVTGFARTLASEVAAYGITVNCILPGYTRTERVVELSQSLAAAEGVSPAEILGRWEAQIPMRRIGEPHEFAALAAFLASGPASYITGTSITVDGGWTRALL